MTTVEKFIFGFFILAYYIVFIKIVNMVLPGLLVFSKINAISIIILIILIIPSFFASRFTLKYLIGDDI